MALAIARGLTDLGELHGRQLGQDVLTIDCGVNVDPFRALLTAQLRELVASGAMGVGVLATDDCRRTYQVLFGKGVTFLSEPAERPYGIEATLRDDSGNPISLTQAFTAA